MIAITAKITIDKFLKMPEAVDTEIIAKVSPKLFNSRLTMVI